MITVDPRRTALMLGVIVASIVSFHLVLQVYTFYMPDDLLTTTLSQRFDLNQEGTVPAYLSTLLLLAAGVVLASISQDLKGQPYHRHWVGLAVVFFILSFDEASSWHETLVVPVRNVLGVGESGWLYWTWVIPGAAFVAAFVLTYIGFLRHLPPWYRWTFILAGALYVGGAIGMELVGGRLAGAGEGFSIKYMYVYTVEETLEMVGALTFLYAVLSFKAEWGQPVSIKVVSEPATTHPG